MRHLPVFGRPTYLRYRPRRYQFQECEDHPTTVQKLDWHDPYSRYSHVYEEHWEELDVLGMDEIALKKGQRNYVTIVTARLSGERIVLLGVLPDRQKDQVVAFLRSIPQRLSETIRTVCCDMPRN